MQPAVTFKCDHDVGNKEGVIVKISLLCLVGFSPRVTWMCDNGMSQKKLLPFVGAEIDVWSVARAIVLSPTDVAVMKENLETSLRVLTTITRQQLDDMGCAQELVPMEGKKNFTVPQCPGKLPDILRLPTISRKSLL
jgi:hypothetical protein